ncbi:HAMP domain-containing histidine kinase [Variovorax sp. S2]|uniref:sensor histidine kinase n=1 Tax=Variovorax sp. S12S4 TaxID=3029170 RepID=UPI00215C3431|nr:HAMP domain-containing histidine kinase [Variovorax sp. S12S4]MCR8960300.1 HAMP domain-containing histidine kinase [Variovorax sp. S12S4]
MRFVQSAWLNSLSFKILLAFVVGVVLSIVLIASILITVLTVRSDLLFVADLVGRAEELAGALQFDSSGTPVGFDAKESSADWMYDSLRQEVAYRVLDASGNAVMSSVGGDAFWAGAARQAGRGYFKFEHNGEPIHGAAVPVEHAGQKWLLQFAASARLADLMHRHFALPFMVAGIGVFSLVLLVVFGACAYLALRCTLKPLRNVAASAAAIAPRSIHARLQVAGVPSEVVPLVESFNRVLERLEHGFRIQQEFLATAAHELKTPLALIRAQIELSEAGAGRDSLLMDVEHMARQVQQLLHLAEASELQNYSFAQVDVREVAGQGVAYLERMAQAAGVHLSAHFNNQDSQAVHWTADRGALFTVLKNLMENAIQHAPRGTKVMVEVGAEAVAVRDWGPGADPEQLSKIFTRFWRGPHRRDHGAGLGLAICQEIAQAHGWKLSAQRAEPGMRFLLARSDAQEEIATTQVTTQGR